MWRVGRTHVQGSTCCGPTPPHLTAATSPTNLRRHLVEVRHTHTHLHRHAFADLRRLPVMDACRRDVTHIPPHARMWLCFGPVPCKPHPTRAPAAAYPPVHCSENLHPVPCGPQPMCPCPHPPADEAPEQGPRHHHAHRHHRHQQWCQPGAFPAAGRLHGQHPHRRPGSGLKLHLRGRPRPAFVPAWTRARTAADHPTKTVFCHTPSTLHPLERTPCQPHAAVLPLPCQAPWAPPPALPLGPPEQRPRPGPGGWSRE